jgi:hypothetical protein
MRRLMTGYAVTYNKRHKRSGHLFQNRYKSIVCEEDPYLLELIRYIHLNPLRAGLVKDLKELDKYPWTGHSAILGRHKNPLIPEVRNLKSEVRSQSAPNQPGQPNKDKESTPSASTAGGLVFTLSSGKGKKQQQNPDHPVNPVKENKPLAEKTIEDVLLHFGDTLKVARRRYRQFVKKGVDQGTRPDLQGGGLIRSAGGDKRGLLGRKKGEREKGDERILGSGDFVANVLKEANEYVERRTRYNISLAELIQRVCKKFETEPSDLISPSRRRHLSKARAVVCYLAVHELGYRGVQVARELNISGRAVSDCLERGKKIACAVKLFLMS